MNAEQLEKVLVHIIEGKGIPALPFPEKPAGYFPEADPGEVLIRYEGEKPQKRDISGVVVRREVYLEIVVVSRQLRGANGAYAWLEELKAQFEGYTLPGAGGPLELESEGFSDESNGTWYFTQKWKLTEVREYEQYDEYADSPLRNQ